MAKHVVGVDVGTGSVRAAVFSLDGKLLGHASSELREWSSPGSVVYEQSFDVTADARLPGLAKKQWGTRE